MTYTETQLAAGNGLSSDRPMIAFTYDGRHWHTCEIHDCVVGEPLCVFTVPPTGWKDRV